MVSSDALNLATQALFVRFSDPRMWDKLDPEDRIAWLNTTASVVGVWDANMRRPPVDEAETFKNAVLRMAESWEQKAAESDDDEYSDRSDAYRDCAVAVLGLLSQSFPPRRRPLGG